MIRTLCTLSLACLFAVPVLADDPAPKKEGDKPVAAAPKKEGQPKKEGEAKKEGQPKKNVDLTKGPQVRTAIKGMETKLTLTEEQKAKLDALVAEMQPKYRARFKNLKFTEEQIAARKAAQAKAKADGLKGVQMTEAVHEAMKLAPEQKAALEEQTALTNEFRKKFSALLTPEQKASLKQKPEAKKN